MTEPGWFSVDLTSAGLCLDQGDQFTVGILGTEGGSPFYLSCTGGYSGGEMWDQLETNPPTLAKGGRDLTFRTYVDVGARSLVASSGPGGVIVSPGAGTFIYRLGETVTIEAEPAAGYRFAGWTGSAVAAGAVDSPSAASTTVTICGNHTLEATFEMVSP